MTEHVKGCSCFLRAYACAGIVDKPAKKPKKLKACTCAPCYRAAIADSFGPEADSDPARRDGETAQEHRARLAKQEVPR